MRQIQLSWNQQFHIDGFTLQRRRREDQQWKSIRAISDEDAVGYTDKKGLVDGADYQYQLLALDNKRVLGKSNTVVGHTKDLPLVPDNIAAQSDLVAQVRVSWEAFDDADVGGYTIYRVDRGELVKLTSVSGADKTGYLDNGGMFDSLEHGTDYSYAVAAYNKYRVEGVRSELVTATTKSVPGAVSGVSAQQDEGVVTLSWEQNSESDIDHYIIARSSRGGCSNFSVEPLPV